MAYSQQYPSSYTTSHNQQPYFTQPVSTPNQQNYGSYNNQPYPIHGVHQVPLDSRQPYTGQAPIPHTQHAQAQFQPRYQPSVTTQPPTRPQSSGFAPIQPQYQVSQPHTQVISRQRSISPSKRQDMPQIGGNVNYSSPLSPTPSVRRPLPKPLPTPQPTVRDRSQTVSGSGPPAPSAYAPALTHRATASMSNGPPTSYNPPPPLTRGNTIAVAPNSAGPSTPSIRPLPNPIPRSSRSVDLTNTSPYNNIPVANGSVRPIPGHATASSVDATQRSASPQKFVPMWRRALPAPNTGSAQTPPDVHRPPTSQSSHPSPPRPLERASSSSRPLPPSPGAIRQGYEFPKPPPTSATRPPPIPSEPVKMMTDRAPATAPLVSSSSGSLLNHRRDRSRTLPDPGPAPSGGLPSRPISMMKPAPPAPPPVPMSTYEETDLSDSDDDISNNPLLKRNDVQTPSPTYGIRDLPSRSSQIQRSNSEAKPAASTRQMSPARGILPQPPTSPLRNAIDSGQSLALRMAALELEKNKSGTPTPALPMMRFQTQPNPVTSRWPHALPQLPRAPGPLPQPPTQPSSSSPIVTRSPSPVKSIAQPPPSPHKLPPRKQSLSNPVATNVVSYTSPDPRHARVNPPNLDDAPPPSLRRSPSPVRPTIRTEQSQTVSPYQRSFASPASPPSSFPPRMAATIPPTAPSAPSRHRALPEVHSRPLHSQPTAPAVSTPPPLTNGRPSIPKISFPANAEDDSDSDSPVITISAPDLSSLPPVISIGNFDDDDDGSVPQIPTISFGGVEDDQLNKTGPGISVGVVEMSPEEKRKRLQHLPPMVKRGIDDLICGGCGGDIIGRTVKMQGHWHPQCFRCCICSQLLENFSSYEHDGRPYCHLDYHDIHAPRCYHCQTTIVDEIFVTLDDDELGKRTYHEQHFFCAECGDPFLPPGSTQRSFSGDGVFKVDEDDIGFTVFKGHPYCEACHVRLRLPKCKRCKRSIRDGMQAVEALGGKWCWECFVCASCERPFETPSFFERDQKPFCERCFSIMIKNEL